MRLNILFTRLIALHAYTVYREISELLRNSIREFFELFCSRQRHIFVYIELTFQADNTFLMIHVDNFYDIGTTYPHEFSDTYQLFASDLPVLKYVENTRVRVS